MSGKNARVILLWRLLYWGLCFVLFPTVFVSVDVISYLGNWSMIKSINFLQSQEKEKEANEKNDATGSTRS